MMLLNLDLKKFGKSFQKVFFFFKSQGINSVTISRGR